jgi:hypothetical protein
MYGSLFGARTDDRTIGPYPYPDNFSSIRGIYRI